MKTITRLERKTRLIVSKANSVIVKVIYIKFRVKIIKFQIISPETMLSLGEI